MIFPNEYKEDIQLKTILEENEDETVSAAFSKKLINEGYEEHVTNKILSSDQTFFHDADHIYSGFNTSENNLISLKTKLTDMVNDIEKYKGKDLLVTRENAVPLKEGEYFICDLIGCTVVSEDGTAVGELTEVMQTAANDVYVVTKPDGEELLIPVTDECVKEISPEEKKITVHLLEWI